MNWNWEGGGVPTVSGTLVVDYATESTSAIPFSPKPTSISPAYRAAHQAEHSTAKEVRTLSAVGTLETRASSIAPVVALSGRQLDVCRLIVQGFSNKEIARALNLAEGTVKIHVAALFSKLGVRRRAAAAVLAARFLSEESRVA